MLLATIFWRFGSPESREARRRQKRRPRREAIVVAHLADENMTLFLLAPGRRGAEWLLDDTREARSVAAVLSRQSSSLTTARHPARPPGGTAMLC